MSHHRADVPRRHEQRPNTTVPALRLQTSLQVRDAIRWSHKGAGGVDDCGWQSSAKRIKHHHLLMDAIDHDEPPVIVLRIDKDQRHTSARLGVQEPRAWIIALEHLHQQVVGDRIHELKEIAHLEWQNQLAMKEQEHEVGDVNVGEPLVVTQRHSTIPR